jgi:endonuclease YncB( thermonuclease family)
MILATYTPLRSFKGLLAPSLAVLGLFYGATADAAPRSKPGDPVFNAGKQAYRVIDGDTIGLGKRRLRILGIDAPEVRGGSCKGVEHPRGRAARDALAALVSPPHRATVRRYQRQRDRFGREVVRVYSDGRSVAGLLIKGGHAVAWKPGDPKPDWCFSPSSNVPFSPSGN